MALFAVGDGRSALVTPTRPAEQSFAAEARAVVHEHLAALLGEKVFVVTTEPGGQAPLAIHRGAPPDILGLDTAGRPVVVEIATTLTGDGLLEAFRVAGKASRLTRSDMAALYAPGPDRFHKDLSDFLEALPVSAGTSQHRGPRLVVVCAEVAPDLLDALRFFRDSGARVDVLHVGMVQGPHDQRFMDVSPLGPESDAARRAVEQALTGATPVVARTSAFGTVAGPTFPTPVVPTAGGAAQDTGVHDAGPAWLAPGSPDLLDGLDLPQAPEDPDDVWWAQTPDPVGGVDASDAAALGEAALHDATSTPHLASRTPYTPVFLDLPDELAQLPERPSGVPLMDFGPLPGLDLTVPPSPESGYAPGPGSGSDGLPTSTGYPASRAFRSSGLAAARKYIPERVDETGGGLAPVPSAPVARTSVLGVGRDRPDALEPDVESGALLTRPYTADVPVRDVPTLHGPVDQDLVRLAADLTEPLEVVWLRLRRGERFVAVLHPDGTLVLDDGTRCADPSWAASSVSGGSVVDGWRVWRAGDDGPTLGELRA
ncbi:hypothetical protein [Sanguibacter suaedae]|uniref:RAMA domain-containing protein n=1 Tax=Sanguibacter suaedae TaxID=2795737 RepID=A0A934ICM1_9MICO|nr:hypothetical protein [Sanguibacter suaedae]MBI9116210.1 hypothetical protein [Sanguibacter suaedae]